MLDIALGKGYCLLPNGYGFLLVGEYTRDVAPNLETLDLDLKLIAPFIIYNLKGNYSKFSEALLAITQAHLRGIKDYSILDKDSNCVAMVKISSEDEPSESE